MLPNEEEEAEDEGAAKDDPGAISFSVFMNLLYIYTCTDNAATHTYHQSAYIFQDNVHVSAKVAWRVT